MRSRTGRKAAYFCECCLSHRRLGWRLIDRANLIIYFISYIINQSQFRISNLRTVDITDVHLYPPIRSPVRRVINTLAIAITSSVDKNRKRIHKNNTKLKKRIVWLLHQNKLYVSTYIKKKMHVKEKFERVTLAVLCPSKVFNAVRLRNVVCV